MMKLIIFAFLLASDGLRSANGVAEDAFKRPDQVHQEVVVANPDTEEKCEGTLELYHKPTGVVESSDIQATILKQDMYGNLGASDLKDRTVVKALVDGNCCWKVFKKSLFRGESIFLLSGFDDRLKFQPRSAKKEDCQSSI